MGDDVVPVAERAVHRLDGIDLAAEAVADENAAGCRVDSTPSGSVLPNAEVLKLDTVSSAVPWMPSLPGKTREILSLSSFETKSVPFAG